MKIFENQKNKLKKEDFFSQLMNACPVDSEIERTNQTIK